MKKKIGYILLILISIVGSRLIFGKDYHLNSDNLIENNLYMYDIFERREVSLSMIDDEYLYYILKNDNTKKIQYRIIKYNLITNKIVNEYNFETNYSLENIKLFYHDKYIYLTSTNSNTFYKFNKHLELVNQINTNYNQYDLYGVFNNNMIMTSNNIIYYQNGVYNTLPSSCGKSVEIIYDKETYLHFHNNNTGFGCLYNIDNKELEYLDYEKLLVVKNRLLEYQDNRQSFKYDGDTYYFNDITESSSLKMHINGDYLFTIDVTNNTLRIYNLETRKTIYEKNLIELNGSIIKDVFIDDYAYFTIVKNNETRLYIWDYLKDTRENKNMISYDEKEYKFKNNELKEEIKNKYNIDINIYDGAVMYFENNYVIPSYDDILINSRLKTLKEIFEKMSVNDVLRLANTNICLEKDIISSSNDNINSILVLKDSNYVIAVNITDDNFKNNILKELVRICPAINSTFNVIN